MRLSIHAATSYLLTLSLVTLALPATKFLDTLQFRTPALPASPSSSSPPPPPPPPLITTKPHNEPLSLAERGDGGFPFTAPWVHGDVCSLARSIYGPYAPCSGTTPTRPITPPPPPSPSSSSSLNTTSSASPSRDPHIPPTTGDAYFEPPPVDPASYSKHIETYTLLPPPTKRSEGATSTAAAAAVAATPGLQTRRPDDGPAPARRQ